MRSTALPWAGLLVLAILLTGSSREPRDQDSQAESGPAYGRTPDTAIPYRHFSEPYLRFFQEVVEFRGPGRDTPPPTPESVRIGLLCPMGPAPDADLGEEMRKGVVLAVEEANASGGYRGIPFEIVLRPDLGLWGATSNEMVRLKHEDHAVAVIGSIDGANTHIALRAALKLAIPMVNTGTTDPTLTETNIPWLLRCMADDRQQGYALAHHIYRELGLRNVVALRVNDRYGRTGIAEFGDAARRLKRPLRAELRWDRGERDFGLQLDRVAALDPEGIVIWGNAADAAAVVQAIRRRGFKARIFGSDRLASPAFLEAAGDAAEGAVAAASYDPTRTDPVLAAFTGAYRTRFDTDPGTFAAHAYDGTRILLDVIQRAGLNQVAIRDTLYEMTHYQGVTGPIEFDTTLNDIGPVYLATVRGGGFVFDQADFAAAEPGPAGTAPYLTMAESPPVDRTPEGAPPETGAEPAIGCFLPLDAEGEAAVRGIRLALDEDADRFPGGPPIHLQVGDSRGAWGDDSSALVRMVFEDRVLALIGSTERRGTHLAEMMAAKAHLPVVSLCGDDPTITRIPLPWAFCVAPAGRGEGDAGALHEDRLSAAFALGHDAAALLASQIREGRLSRRALRDGLSGTDRFPGASGEFRFDALGNRVEAGDPPRGDGNGD